MQKKFPNHVICGYDKITKLKTSKFHLPKVVVIVKELIYISRFTLKKNN